MPASEDTRRVRLSITGQVQGVGFRPFVYRLAARGELTGHVYNDASGVTIEVQGRHQDVERFQAHLTEQLPPLARIRTCQADEIDPVVGENRFEIRPSAGGELLDAQVTVDVATCPDCLREMNDPGDPRYRYPFVNCTNCGPRYSIIRRIPYDRPNTSMSQFAMCPLCASEYTDPASRRFHAQPVACAMCGPAVWLVDVHGRQILCDDPIAEAARAIRDGRIVAIKGLGGFQLACRADEPHVVRRLRMRKRRDAKPFALMVADLVEARRLGKVDPEAEALLTGPVRPIVLLPRGHNTPVADSVAPGVGTLGVMLPYTPLHHLLFAEGIGPCVMTSGNYSEEPLVKDNDEAVAHLGQIADMLLLHNRDIVRSLDDSVVQMHADGRASVVRRARGYAPQPIHLGAGDGGGTAILAVGAELRNAVCLFRSGRAVLSEHVGDLKDGRAYRHFIRVIDDLEDLFEIEPEWIVADMHPHYLSTEYAGRRAKGEMPGRGEMRLLRVQHHHAHVVSCLAENGRTGPVIGLACDGVGYGNDGATWGGEILQADVREYERLGHLRYLPLPGGDAAAEQTYRPAVAALYSAFGDDWGRHLDACRIPATMEQIDSAVAQLRLGVNCPWTSSLGRWFDAIAGLCGLTEANRYEGQAPMEVEAAAEEGMEGRYSFELVGAGPFEIDLRPMVRQIVADLTDGVDVGRIAARFHNTVVDLLMAGARRAREETQLNVVAFSGGCFANRILTAGLTRALEADGFEILRHHLIPCNDGGIALGQAVVAAARVGVLSKMTPEPLR